MGYKIEYAFMIGDAEIDKMTSVSAIKTYLDQRSILVQLVSRSPDMEVEGICLELLRISGVP